MVTYDAVTHDPRSAASTLWLTENNLWGFVVQMRYCKELPLGDSFFSSGGKRSHANLIEDFSGEYLQIIIAQDHIKIIGSPEGLCKTTY